MAKSPSAACKRRSLLARAKAPRATRLDPVLAGLAWAFLRRNPDYRAEWAMVTSGAAPALSPRWGLKAPIDPDRDDVDATAIWASDPHEPAAAPAVGPTYAAPSSSARGRMRGKFSSNQRSAL